MNIKRLVSGKRKLLIIAVLLVGMLGYLLWIGTRSDTTDTNTAGTTSGAPGASSRNNQAAGSIDSTTGDGDDAWKTYSNTEARLKFEYPGTWTHRVNNPDRYPNGSFGGASGTVTSPDGKQLAWTFRLVSGLTDFCEIAPTDKLFRAGNSCPSRQIISTERVQSIVLPAGAKHWDLYKDSLYITHTKFMAKNGAVTYQVCLDPYYDGATPRRVSEVPKRGSQMGNFAPCKYNGSGFNVTYVVDSVPEFKAADTITAQQIMRTFDSF